MDKKIKLAIVRTDSNSVSADFYNSQEIGLARGLSLLGIDTDVFIAGDSKHTKISSIETSGSGEIRLHKLRFFRLPAIGHALYPELQGHIKAGNYDFVQVNEYNEFTSYLVARFCFKNGIPVVIYQGMYKRLTGRVSNLFQNTYDALLVPRLQHYLYRTVAKTTWAQRYLRKLGFEDVKVIPVGLDTLPFRMTKTTDWIKKLQIPTDHQVVLYVGVFEERRNIDLMLDIAATLRNQKVTFVLVGDGEIFPRIQDRKNQEELDNVVLPGSIPQEQLPGLYDIAALFLLPSEYEIFGMVVLEAMYFGTPVISSRTAGPDNIINLGLDGILLDGFQSKHWSNTVSNLLESQDTLTAMSETAKNNVKANFTWEVISQQYVETLILPATHEG